VATVAVVAVTSFSFVLLWALRTIVLYVIVAVFFAVLLAPAVALLQRRGMRRSLATTIIFLVGLACLIGLGILFGQPLVNAVTRFSHQAPHLVSQAEKGRGPIGHLVRRFHLQNWVNQHAPQLSKYAASLSKPLIGFGAAAISTIVALLTMVVLSFYVLLELPSLWRSILNTMSQEHAQRVDEIANHASRAVSGYVLGNVVTSIIAGLIVFLTLSVLGVPFAALLALWVAIIDLLPLVGGLLAGVPTVLIAGLHSLTAGIVTLIVFLIYQQIENHLLNPLVMARTVRMRPALVLLAVLVGAELGGRLHGGFGTVIGALIGIPAGSALQVIVSDLRAGRPRELDGDALS
jgi:predicted PurR-regulated permease PerM